GKKDHIHMSLVGERSILAVIFDDRTTIGMVRLYAKETAIELAKIFDKIKKESQTTTTESTVSSEFTAIAENRLDDIFQD
ncbi:MAG: roadblock/LC7 domain-containing protein, partial [Candidatus Zixiibacteriota bacterium]